MGILLTISDLLIPVTVLCIVVFGCLQRMDIYEVFLEGAKEGLQTVLDILPTLIGLMMAVEVMRAGGLLDILVRLIVKKTPMQLYYQSAFRQSWHR